MMSKFWLYLGIILACSGIGLKYQAKLVQFVQSTPLEASSHETTSIWNRAKVLFAVWNQDKIP